MQTHHALIPDSGTSSGRLDKACWVIVERSVPAHGYIQQRQQQQVWNWDITAIKVSPQPDGVKIKRSSPISIHRHG